MCSSDLYRQVCSGTTGHAEAVRVEFDPRVISYRELLERFFSIHDPTTPDRQGNDVGTQYRPAVFYSDERQKKEALAYIGELRRSGRYGGRPVVTAVEPAADFWDAEDHHQKYLARNPGGYCHVRLDGVYGGG